MRLPNEFSRSQKLNARISVPFLASAIFLSSYHWNLLILIELKENEKMVTKL